MDVKLKEKLGNSEKKDKKGDINKVTLLQLIFSIVFLQYKFQIEINNLNCG